MPPQHSFFRATLSGAIVTATATLLSCGLAIQVEKTANRCLYSCAPAWYASAHEAAGLTASQLARARTLAAQQQPQQRIGAIKTTKTATEKVDSNATETAIPSLLTTTGASSFAGKEKLFCGNDSSRTS